MTGSQIFVQGLINEGVDRVFGYAGATICSLMDEMMKVEDTIRYTLVRQEQNAGHMASGYARVTGKTGVCMVTSGPGATNLITGIATAYMDSIPMVAVTGQVPTNLIGRDIFQEVDILGAVTPFIKHSYLVKDARELPNIIKEAFYIASTGRPGPVLIDFPQNIQDQEVKDPVFPDTVHIRGYNPSIKGNGRQLTHVIHAISEAKKPVICAGGGVFLAHAEAELKSFAHEMNIPVVTTMMGLSLLDTDDPLNMGMIGKFGNRSANKAMVKADLLIMIGMRVADRAIMEPNEVKRRLTTIHIDVDSAEIGKNMEANIPLVGDAGIILNKLSEQCTAPDTAEWRAFLKDYRAEELGRDFPEHPHVSPQRFMRKLGHHLEEGTAVCVDVGQNQLWACQHLYMHGIRFLTSGGLGTMGYGLPCGIGVKIAQPERKTVVINGDGSFQMSMNELAVVRANRLDLKIIIIRNHVLGLVHQSQVRAPFHGAYGVDLEGDPDFEALIASYGIPSMVLEDDDKTDEALEAFLNSEGPQVLIVNVDSMCSTTE